MIELIKDIWKNMATKKEKIIPLGRALLVRPSLVPRESTTSGLIINNAVQYYNDRSVIVAMGDEEFYKKEFNIEIGDVVVHAPHNAHTIDDGSKEVNENTRKILKDENYIFAVIKK